MTLLATGRHLTDAEGRELVPEFREDPDATASRHGETRTGQPPDYALQWARNLIARRLGPHGPTA